MTGGGGGFPPFDGGLFVLLAVEIRLIFEGFEGFFFAADFLDAFLVEVAAAGFFEEAGVDVATAVVVFVGVLGRGGVKCGGERGII